VKSVELIAVPPGAVTLIGPLVAPLGTAAVICVSEVTVKEVDVPLKAAAVAAVRFEPVIVTLVPAGPPVGVKELRVGELLVDAQLQDAIRASTTPPG
jgi:hypothetical protein